jgi:hypothetical protein
LDSPASRFDILSFYVCRFRCFLFVFIVFIPVISHFLGTWPHVFGDWREVMVLRYLEAIRRVDQSDTDFITAVEHTSSSSQALGTFVLINQARRSELSVGANGPAIWLASSNTITKAEWFYDLFLSCKLQDASCYCPGCAMGALLKVCPTYSTFCWSARAVKISPPLH